MALLRSARFPAFLLLAAAALGLLLANTATAGPLADVLHADVDLLGLHLTVGHVVSEGLLALFFFTVAVELRHELTRGALSDVRAAAVPALAAAGGVAVPALVYVTIAGGDLAHGWPVPTATDIAFALGVLALVGRGLPPAVRLFLLTLAILDDLAGIVFIAVLFTERIDLVALGVAAVAVVIFGVIAARRMPVAVRWALLVPVALVAWTATALSGVHATIAGVALGLVCAPALAARVRHALEPAVNGLVLPLFAFTAAAVTVPQVAPNELSPAFWGVLVALPVGKLVGIAGVGFLAQRLLRAPAPLPFGDLAAVAALGGIGFTVSLLLASLAFGGDPALAAQGALAVLAGSGLSLVLAAVLVSIRARGYRRTGERS